MTWDTYIDIAAVAFFVVDVLFVMWRGDAD